MSDARLGAALQALTASRLALREELVPSTTGGGAAGAAAGSARMGGPAWWRRWRRAARLWPITALASDALQRWWHQQPWHSSSAALATGLTARLRPVVQRHPWASLFGAAALGALLVGSKPWRWPLLGPHLRHWPTHASRWTLAQLASAPVQAALTAMLLRAAFRAGEQGAGSSTPRPTPAPAPTNKPPETSPAAAASAASAAPVAQPDRPF